MLKVSATRLKTFAECRNKYFFHYIAGYKEPTNIYMLRGSAVHKALELLYTQGKSPFETYNEVWFDGLKQHPTAQHSTKLFLEGDDMLSRYMENHDDTSGVEAERYFCLPFPDKENPIALIEGYWDLYLPTQTTIIDFKTARNRPTQEQLDNDWQFIIYAGSHQQIYDKPAAVFWHHLRTGEYIAASVHNPQKLVPIVNVIKELETFVENPEALVMNKTCRYCPYVKECTTPPF